MLLPIPVGIKAPLLYVLRASLGVTIILPRETGGVSAVGVSVPVTAAAEGDGGLAVAAEARAAGPTGGGGGSGGGAPPRPTGAAGVLRREGAAASPPSGARGTIQVGARAELQGGHPVPAKGRNPAALQRDGALLSEERQTPLGGAGAGDAGRTIKSMSSNLCVTDVGPPTKKLTMHYCDGRKRQKWYFLDSTLRNLEDATMCLGYNASGGASNVFMQSCMLDYTRSSFVDGQRWYWQGQKLKNAASSFAADDCLNCAANSTTTACTMLHMTACNDVKLQHWYFQQDPMTSAVKYKYNKTQLEDADVDNSLGD